MGMDKLLESKRQLEGINEMADQPANEGGARYRRVSGPRFEERYKRVTTYLTNEIHQELQILRSQGRLFSLTAFFNSSVREHLKKVYRIDVK